MLPLLGCAVRIIVLLLLGLFSTTATAQTNVTDSILFFYSPVLDQCEWGPSNSFQATNNTVNGGVCGYIPAKNRLYACPAPDPTCWTWNQNCKSGTDTPSSDQILCGDSNAYQWCCASYETCTLLSGQINVCVSTFSSPNSGVNRKDAESKLYSALPSESIGTTVPDSTPKSVFSTRMGSTTTSGTSTSLSVSVTSTGTVVGATSATTGTVVGPGATSGTTTATPAPGSTDNKGGAIAGIVVGAVAAIAIAIVAGIIIVIYKQKRRPLPGKNAAGYGPGEELYKQPLMANPTPQELPPSTTPQELPLSTTPQELPPSTKVVPRSELPS